MAASIHAGPILGKARPDRLPFAVRWAILVLSLVALVHLDSQQQHVALPMLAALNITVFFLTVLWERDRQLPLFDAGALCALATAMYTVAPLAGFLLAGMTWTEASDSRLYVLQPEPHEVGAFFWRHVTYLLALCAVYLLVRGRPGVPTREIQPVNRKVTWWLLGTLLFLVGTLSALEAVYGITFAPSYADLFDDRVRLPTEMPYFLQQVSHNVLGIRLILKECLLLLLLRQWANPKWRLALLLWLGGEVAVTIVRMGARYELILLLVSAVLLYHRLVRPLRLLTVCLGGVLFMSAFLAYGWARDQLIWTPPEGGSPYAANNEFQALFATSYDIHDRRNELDVPWQVQASELLMPIPSQLLPVEKIDPSEWYLDIIDQRGTGVGFMFGVISKALIGWDWVELVLRGAVLGLIFAWIHRWYVRQARSILVTMLYLFLCQWCYYTFRDTTFSIAYYVLYRFVPFAILFLLLQRFSSTAGGRKKAATASTSLPDRSRCESFS